MSGITVKASVLPDLLDHLKVNLEARLAALAVSEPDPTLAEVAIHTAIIRMDEAGEAIEFGNEDTDSDAEWATYGNQRREEDGRLGGLIWIVTPGSGDETIKVSRDRAFLLFNILATELRANPGQWLTSQMADSAVRVAMIVRYRFLQAPTKDGWLAQIQFTLEYNQRLPV